MSTKPSGIKFDRGAFHDLICRKVGIPKRVRPRAGYFSKRELLQINSFLDIKLSTRETINGSNTGE